jgi:DNA-binding MarR family transcriptional regulator
MDPIGPHQREFVERFAVHLARQGLPRMSARVLALFVCAPQQVLSATDVMAGLGISQAAASPALRGLEQRGLLAWTPVPGSRRDHYRLVEDTGITAVLVRQREFAELAALAELGATGLARDAEAARRLARMADFYAFLATELPALVTRWEERAKSPEG